MYVGKYVKIKLGASKWMKEHGFFDGIPKSIDGMIGIVINDYTGFTGDDSHLEIQFDELKEAGFTGIGVHPDFVHILNRLG